MGSLLVNLMNNIIIRGHCEVVCTTVEKLMKLICIHFRVTHPFFSSEHIRLSISEFKVLFKFLLNAVHAL